MNFRLILHFIKRIKSLLFILYISIHICIVLIRLEFKQIRYLRKRIFLNLKRQYVTLYDLGGHTSFYEKSGS